MKVVILYNTSEYLVRFRTELMQSLMAAGWEVVAVTPPDETTERLGLMGVRWREWQLKGKSVNPLYDLQSIYRLHGILRAEKPDAILCFTIKPVLYGSLVGHWVGTSQIVSMIAGMGSMFGSGSGIRRVLLPLIRVGYRLAMRRNHKVLFQNQDDMAYFVKHRFVQWPQVLRTNGSGVNLHAFTPGTAEPVKGSFLLIARMIEEKGVREFASAARIVKRRFPNAHFALLGPVGEDSNDISMRDIAAWEEEGIVEYLGKQDDVCPFLARSEVYVLPSYYFEGVPRSILEAMAMGKPIITSDWRGCRDTVEAGVNGFLVPPRDVEALASTMAGFLENPGLSASLGAASRRMAEDKFDVTVVNRTVMTALGYPTVGAP